MVLFVSFFDGSSQGALFDFNILDYGSKGGMTAVVRPVGIQHTDLGNAGITLFHVAEIFLSMQKVSLAHGQAQILQHSCDLFFVFADETGNGFNGLRHTILHFQSFRFFQSSFTGVNCIDTVSLDLGHIFVGQITLQQIHLCAGYLRIFVSLQNTDTLLCRVSSLVVLTGQILHSKALQIFCIHRNLFHKYIIHRSFRQNTLNGLFVNTIGQIVHIVTMQNTNFFQLLHVQIITQVFQQAGCFNTKAGLFTHIHTSNRHYCTSLCKIYYLTYYAADGKLTAGLNHFGLYHGLSVV